MWPSKKGNVSDQNLHSSQDWKHDLKGKDSLYDSGRTDSGFLSGANILTESLSEGELTPPPPSTEKDNNVPDSKSLMRLDSGVDVGLSDQLSELCIEESYNDLSCESKWRSPYEIVSRNISDSDKADSVPWEICFQQDEDGNTQLHIAVVQGFAEAVHNLIRMVPNPTYLDIRNDIRQTGLHLAVLTSQPNIVRQLVCAGARTDIVDRNGNTPLHLATESGNLDCVQALTNHIQVHETAALSLKFVPVQMSSSPPELDMFNYEGLTCAHLAVMKSCPEILWHLHWLGADVNAREWKSGKTPLHIALESGHEALVVLLLKKMGALPTTRTYAGHTAYRYARTNPAFQDLLDSSSFDSDYSSSEDEDEDDEEFSSVDTFHSLRNNGGGIMAQ